VIEGRELNAEPLSRIEANRLAKGEPVSAATPQSPPPKRKPAAAAQSAPQPALVAGLRAEP